MTWLVPGVAYALRGNGIARRGRPHLQNRIRNMGAYLKHVLDPIGESGNRLGAMMSPCQSVLWVVNGADIKSRQTVIPGIRLASSYIPEKPVAEVRS